MNNLLKTRTATKDEQRFLSELQTRQKVKD